MKVLILGGTGAMGKHLVSLLNRPEHRVYVTSRSKHENTGSIKYFHGNAHDLAFLEGILSGENYDAIVDFMIYTKEEFSERVESLLNATKQYVYLSSARVYADEESPIRETSPRLLNVTPQELRVNDDRFREYAFTKALQENILTESRRKNWTIIRPYITYSDIRLQLGTYEKEKWLYRAVHGRKIVFSKELLEKKTTLTYGQDVSSVIVKLLGNPTALGEVFHITGEKALSWGEVLNCYLDVLEEHLGKRPKVYLSETGVEVYHIQYQYDRMYNRVFDNSKIIGVIGEYDFVPPEIGLKEEVKKFLEHDCSFRIIDWDAEVNFDRLTGDCAHRNEFSNDKQYIIYLLKRFVSPKIIALLKRVKRKIIRK